MRRLLFWLRWSWRDLRRRWLLVLATSLVIAVGTGLFTGLGSLERWRVGSADASYAALNAHDLRVALAEGSFASAGELEGALAALPESAAVRGAEERLVIAAQIDASQPRHTVLTPGRLVGIDLSREHSIDRIAVVRGRGLSTDDAGTDRAVLEASYAEANDLPAAGELRVAGGQILRYVGHGRSPDTFVVTLPGGLWIAPGTFGVAFVPLDTAQRLAGRPGAVNELVIDLRPDVDAAVLAARVERALDARLPQYGVTVTPLEDEESRRLVYEDARNDQQVFGVFSLLVVAGAAFAAFTLAGRIVEAQRREIGIGMSLGVPPRALALRPLLVGAQIALLGAGLGVLVGLVVGRAMRGVLEANFPLPILETPLELDVLLRGAAIGFGLPFVATVLPVWRGVRVRPVDAIRVGPRSARGVGVARLARRLPGSATAQMPVRNLLRTPRRTLATVLAIAGVITVVVALAGMVDSFRSTIDIAANDLKRGVENRMVAGLDGYYPASASEVARVKAATTVRRAEPLLDFPAELRAGDTTIDAAVQLVDPESELWRPEAVAGSFERGSEGILLSKKAARDLGVGVGDNLVLRHPERSGEASFRIVETPLPVAGLHPSPSRPLAFMDEGQADALGLAGLVSGITLVPAAGFTVADVERELFTLGGVASVGPVTETVDALDDQVDNFVSIIQVAEIAALALALLIAFNAVTISAEERRRDHATMFAFGLPSRSVLGVGVAESTITGFLGTTLGIGLGYVVLLWIVRSLVSDSFPEIGMEVSIAPLTYAAAVIVGIAALAAAPLLTLRRLHRMDIPATLRVVE